MNAPVCYRVSDLAERWAVSESVIRCMVTRGDLPSMRLGKLIRIPISAAHAYEVECLTQPLASAASPAETPGTSTTSAVAYLRAARIGLARRSS